MSLIASSTLLYPPFRTTLSGGILHAGSKSSSTSTVPTTRCESRSGSHSGRMTAASSAIFSSSILRRRSTSSAGKAGANRSCSSAHQTSGCMCTETPFPCACQRFRIRLVLLQLRHGRRNGVAAPGQAAVDGSDPPLLGMPRSASRRVGVCTPMPPFAGGVAPVSISPSREGDRGSGWRWASTSYSLARRRFARARV